MKEETEWMKSGASGSRSNKKGEKRILQQSGAIELEVKAICSE